MTPGVSLVRTIQNCHDLAVVLAAVALSCIASLSVRGESLQTVHLEDIDSGLTSPQGQYRWMDVANQLYAGAYQQAYNYTQATVDVNFFTNATMLHGNLAAGNLKPNFAYQVKLVGKPESDEQGNESIGLTGRWWQEEWNGSAWVNGMNLNNKGDGTSPNPNDSIYFSRRDIVDASSPTGRKYRYTGYLLFEYFITDALGDAIIDFQADDSYHVLFKITQRTPTTGDGPIRNATYQVALPDPVGAYDAAYSEVSIGVYGEWERLPPGAVTLPVGTYTADLILTEESFHGSGLAGNWAAAMGRVATFTVVPDLMGDANNDGAVNLTDLQIVGDNWQSTQASWFTGDFTGDGIVNLADLQVIGDNWSFGTSTDLAFEDALASTGDPIPEPGALAFLLLSVCVMRGRR